MSNFNKGLQSVLVRLKNPGTIMAITGGVLLILKEIGVVVDSDKVNNVMSALCYILITVGVLNDSTSKGIYIPFIKDKYLKEESEEKKEH